MDDHRMQLSSILFKVAAPGKYSPPRRKQVNVSPMSTAQPARQVSYTTQVAKPAPIPRPAPIPPLPQASTASAPARGSNTRVVSTIPLAGSPYAGLESMRVQNALPGPAPAYTPPPAAQQSTPPPATQQSTPAPVAQQSTPPPAAQRPPRTSTDPSAYNDPEEVGLRGSEPLYAERVSAAPAAFNYQPANRYSGHPVNQGANLEEVNQARSRLNAPAGLPTQAIDSSTGQVIDHRGAGSQYEQDSRDWAILDSHRQREELRRSTVNRQLEAAGLMQAGRMVTTNLTPRQRALIQHLIRNGYQTYLPQGVR
jgi:hypothetical protein